MTFGPLLQTLPPGAVCCAGHSLVPEGAVVFDYVEVFTRGGALLGRLANRSPAEGGDGQWWLRGGPQPIGPWPDLARAKRAVRVLP